MKHLCLMVLILLVAGCASTRSAHSDYDRLQDFSAYRTFAWISDDPVVTAPGVTPSISPLNRRRVVEAIEATLTSKGLTRTDQRDSADFVVAYTLGARDRLIVDSWPTPYGRWGRWRWPYNERTVVETYREGTLAIDIFDGRSREPVWHGWTSKRITAADIRDAREPIRRGVNQVLESFPPK